MKTCPNCGYVLQKTKSRSPADWRDEKCVSFGKTYRTLSDHYGLKLHTVYIEDRWWVTYPGNPVPYAQGWAKLRAHLTSVPIMEFRK